MSLSTLLEAAKYLDYLDSNNQQPQHLQLQYQSNQQQPSNKRSTGRRRISKKNAANTMVAMSLPASTRPIPMNGVPIPVVSHSSGGDSHQTASLSSSFTTGSPLSSFASTALFCSKASGVTSASSSAASSLSSSDSSSSCGEILMGDNDFNHQSLATNSRKRSNNNNYMHNNTVSSNNHHNYHLTNQNFENFQQQRSGGEQSSNSINYYSSSSNGNNHHIARYIAATSAGPQLVTMTTNSALASTSAPVDGSLRAGHVIHAATNHSAMLNAKGNSAAFDSHCYSLATTNGVHTHQALECHEGQTFNIGPGSSFGSDNHLSSSPGSCGPLIMTRVQPMILNSLSPASAQSIMAFQPATASSPTSSSSSYSRHRELHKTLEKNRRAHLRHCFELLKSELPVSECVDKKTSHINIIKSAIRYVLALRQQECEIENELQRLTRIKTELTENLSKMRTDEPMVSAADIPTTLSISSSPASPSESKLKQDQQPPAAEQQLSFLLSQSKID